MNYTEYHLNVLRIMAKEAGIPHPTTYKKAELIAMLLEKGAFPEEENEEESRKEPVKETPASFSGNTFTEAAKEPSGKEVFEKRGPAVYPEERPNQETQNPREPVFYQNNRRRRDFSQVELGGEGSGILEVMPDGYGFLRCDNYLPGDGDVYVAAAQIRRFNLKTGDVVGGLIRKQNPTDKFPALMRILKVNGDPPEVAEHRPDFDDLTPIFPDERINLERPGCPISMRIMDILCPIGKGQRGMIVSQPKAGKTTLLKQIACSILENHPEIHLLVLLIDERPEEVTDIKETIEAKNGDAEVIYSTFDELPENHKRVSEMVIERAKRLVEQGRDVAILLDSITRLARAYNLIVPPSGRTLSGGLDPAALHMPKRFFGAARNMRNGGSLTILATALVETGSRMDDVVFEEFKGTGNMELVLNRKLSEHRMFPAIDMLRSSTRNDNLLLSEKEQEAMVKVHRVLSGLKSEEASERIIELFTRTKTNQEFLTAVSKNLI